MSGWATASTIALIPLVPLLLGLGISCQMEIVGLWKYLREHHFRTWIALGGPGAASESMTQRGIDGLRKIYAALDPIEDAELKRRVQRLRRHEALALRILVPWILLVILGFMADGLARIS